MKIRGIAVLLMATVLCTLSGCKKSIDIEVYQALEEEYAVLKNTLEEVCLENENYILKYDELNEKYEIQSSEYEDYKEELERQNEEYMSSMEEYNQKISEYDILLKKNEEQIKEIANLNVQNTELQTQLMELKNAYAVLSTERDGLNEEILAYQGYIQNLQNQIDAYVQQQQLKEYLETYDTGITYEQLCEEPEVYTGQKILMKGIIMTSKLTEDAFELVVAIDGDESCPMMFTGGKEWAEGGYEAGRGVILYAVAAGEYSLMEAIEESEKEIETIPVAVFDYII